MFFTIIWYIITSSQILERLMMIMLLLIIWCIITAVQVLFGYGTAYRLTKRGGDNGVALFGWVIVMSLAAAVPGLGIFLWFQYKEKKDT